MKNKYRCQECGYEIIKWLGKCPKCESYDSFIDISDNFVKKYVTRLENVQAIDIERIKTEIKSVDSLLGGGFVKGSLNLLVSNPGLGKSTLVLQMINKMYEDINVLYISSEESLGQIKIRAERIGFTRDVLFLNDSSLENIINTIYNNQIKFAIIDSIQTTFTDDSDGAIGSVSQLKAITTKLMKVAKESNVTILIIGHVTKEGDVAGPKLLEHMVDVVVQIKNNKNNVRELRSMKNRFGNTNEIYYFLMKNNGLVEFNMEFDKISIRENIKQVGLCISAIKEGQHIMFVETQGLTVKTCIGSPKRITQGIEINRIHMLIAVLNSKTKIDLSYVDVYAKLFDGVKSKDTNTDLALLIALYSAYKELEIPRNFLFIGEVNLTGDITTNGSINKIIEHAEKQGFKKIFLSSEKKFKSKKSEVIPCRNINEVIKLLWR